MKLTSSYYPISFKALPQNETQEHNDKASIPPQIDSMTIPYGKLPMFPMGFYVSKIWDKADRAFNEYKNSLYTDNPEKVMDIIDGDMPAEWVIRFLQKVTSSWDTAFAFIDEVTKDEDGHPAPEKSEEIVGTLVEKMGGKDNFKKWYLGKGGYTEAFNYYAKKMFKETETVEEVVQYMPNWAPWAIRDKFQHLQKQQGVEPYELQKDGDSFTVVRTDSFTLGNLPEEFGDKEDFRDFISDLRASLCLGNTDEVCKQNGFNKVHRFDKGASGKSVLLLDDKYVLKFSNIRNIEKNAEFFNDNSDVAPDSPYLNSLVDYYTTAHAPDNAAKLYYYDDFSGAAIYEYVKGQKPNLNPGKQIQGTPPEGFFEHFKDITKIGISYTDYNEKNYIETADKTIKCIDSGHCVYFDILKPNVRGHTISLTTSASFNPYELEGRLAQITD